MNKIGVGILTNNRPDMFKELLESLPAGNNDAHGEKINTYVVYATNDSFMNAPAFTSMYHALHIKCYTFTRPTCISWCKNQLLRMMINDDCKHLFLLEDDIKIADPLVFEKYIAGAENTGILSLCYKGDSKVRNAIDINGTSITFADTLNRSFVYYPKSFIKTLGFYDERYDKSTIEHIDLTYRFIKAGVLPQWGWFADLEGSENMIKQIPHTSSDKTSDEYKARYWYECSWFKHKYGSFHFQLPAGVDTAVLTHVEKLKDMYGKKQ